MAEEYKDIEAGVQTLPGDLQRSLAEQDPEVYELLQKEQHRQWRGLELIASENFTSRAVFEALGSCFTNKYSEGVPGNRYYGGTEVIDELENLCQTRALKAFHLDSKEWGVNVQPYSGSTANFAAYNAILQPHERLMGLDLPSGGHLTHGYYTDRRKISATSVYFESLPYKVNPETGQVDYEALEANAKLFLPRVIVCGGSAYPQEWDYARLRKIADSVGALLMCDMAHISGLVASRAAFDPFPHCHLVTTTTHKSLRGPRAAMIFYRRPQEGEKDPRLVDLPQRIDFSVFPALQGGPHNNAIAGIAVQLKEVASPEFVAYSKQVVANSKHLADLLTKKGYELASGGTENHLMLWNLRPIGVSGSKMEYLCDHLSITLNKNSIHGDKSALSPGGVRLGTPALTSRGFTEKEFDKVADFLDRAAQLCKRINSKAASPKVVDFKKVVDGHDSVDQEVRDDVKKRIDELREEVESFAKAFEMPGFDIQQCKDWEQKQQQQQQ